MSVYGDLITAAIKGKRFKVDLIDKSLWIDKKQIIEKGVVLDGTKDLIKNDDFVFDKSKDVWGLVEDAYKLYKFSVPSEHDNSKSYFKALSVDDLTDADLSYNLQRTIAQAILEGFILLASLQGWLKWEFGEHWFWQGTDKDLVVLKNWIE